VQGFLGRDSALLLPVRSALVAPPETYGRVVVSTSLSRASSPWALRLSLRLLDRPGHRGRNTAVAAALPVAEKVWRHVS
jgi:hypothetical protein